MHLAAELRLRPDPLEELTALPIYTSWIWGRGRAWGGKGKGRGKGRGQGKREGTGDSGEERGRDGKQGEGREGKGEEGKEMGSGRGGSSPQNENRSDANCFAGVIPERWIFRTPNYNMR